MARNVFIGTDVKDQRIEHARNNPIKPKTEMTTEEIDNVLKETQLHNRNVAIQTQDRDLNGSIILMLLAGFWDMTK